MNMKSEQASFYCENGYLVAPNLLATAEVAELKREATQIFRGRRGHVDGLA